MAKASYEQMTLSEIEQFIIRGTSCYYVVGHRNRRSGRQGWVAPVAFFGMACNQRDKLSDAGHRDTTVYILDYHAKKIFPAASRGALDKQLHGVHKWTTGLWYPISIPQDDATILLARLKFLGYTEAHYASPNTPSF